MTVESPRHATRIDPSAAGLDARLLHASGWPALSITGSPQTVDLELTNRTPFPVMLDAAEVAVLLRPGVLEDTARLVLAPQSEAAWGLSIDADTGPSGQGNLRLTFRSAHAGAIAPGSAITLRLDGVSVGAAGGSRATRVEVSYTGFHHADGREVAGVHLLHVPLLRRGPPEPLTLSRARSGASALAGPFLAGFVSASTLERPHTEQGVSTGILNDGLTANCLVLRVMNVSGRPVRLSGDGDAATRLHLNWSTAAQHAPWGLMQEDGDHLTLQLGQAPDHDWQVDGHSLRRLLPGTLPPGGYIELDLTIHSHAETGATPFVLSFENLPDYDDDDLVLLPELGPMVESDAALSLVKPLDLYGRAARIAFHPSGMGQSGAGAAATLSVNRSDAPGRLEIDAPNGLTISDTARVDGQLTAAGGLLSRGPVIHKSQYVDSLIFEIAEYSDGSYIRLKGLSGGVAKDGLTVEPSGKLRAHNGMDMNGSLDMIDGGLIVRKGGLNLMGPVTMQSELGRGFSLFSINDTRADGSETRFGVRGATGAMAHALTLTYDKGAEFSGFLKAGEVTTQAIDLLGGWRIQTSTGQIKHIQFWYNDELKFAFTTDRGIVDLT